jgi:hypothetical protein
MRISVVRIHGASAKQGFALNSQEVSIILVFP